MQFLFQLLVILFQIFEFILLARVLLSWVPNIDRSNPLIQLVYDITEPVLRPVRDLLPQTPGIDLSPLVVIVLIQLFIQVLWAF